MTRLNEMSQSDYARWQDEYYREREPRCDTCGVQHGEEGCE